MGSCAICSGRCHADRTHHSVCESPPKGSFSCQTFMLQLYNCCKVHAHARPKLLEEHLGKTPDLSKPMCPSGLPMIGEFIRDCVGGNRKLAQSYQLISPIAFQQQKWKRNRHSHDQGGRNPQVLKRAPLKVNKTFTFSNCISCHVIFTFFVGGKSQSESKHDPGHSRTENN